MASFQSTITAAGVEAITKALALGQELPLVRAAAGSGRLSGEKNQASALAQPLAAEVNIAEKQFIESNPSYLLLPIYIRNQGLTEAVYIREVMVYALDTDGKELPFAYSWLDGEDTDNILPATRREDGASDTAHIHELELLATDQINAVVQIEVNGGSWVTAAQMEKYAVKKPQADGSPGQFLRRTAEGAEWAMPARPVICNPNLLDNWYFGNLVNQNGRQIYDTTSSAAFMFDRWWSIFTTVTMNEKSVTLQGMNENYGAILRQPIFHPKKFAGQTVTFSLLSKNRTTTAYLALVTGTEVNRNLLTIKSIGGNQDLMYATTTIPEDVGSDEKPILMIAVNVPGKASIEMEAMKIELGTEQTLAHQDSNGDWVLNELPNYAEQASVCSQYDPVTGEYIGAAKVNHTHTAAAVGAVPSNGNGTMTGCLLVQGDEGYQFRRVLSEVAYVGQLYHSSYNIGNLPTVALVASMPGTDRNSAELYFNNNGMQRKDADGVLRSILDSISFKNYALALNGANAMSGNLSIKRGSGVITSVGQNASSETHQYSDFSQTDTLGGWARVRVQTVRDNAEIPLTNRIALVAKGKGDSSHSQYKIYGEHNITCGTTDLSAGTAALATGCIYQVYE